MSAVLIADNSTLLSQICSHVCQTIVTIQEQQPELLVEKYRVANWRASNNQLGLTNKLIEVLKPVQEAKAIQLRVQQFLKALLLPEAFGSSILIDLFKTLNQTTLTSQPILNQTAISNQIEPSHEAENITQTTNPNQAAISLQANQTATSNQIEPSSHEAENIPHITNPNQAAIISESSDTIESNKIEPSQPATPIPPIPPTVNIPSTQTGISVLLLDAENLQFNTETEKFFTTVCKYPIQVKVAFANWCRKGRLDAELHRRGYDLIQVPSGRDNADGKMITFGSAIHERFANAKEVLVCSSDNVMMNLCNLLQQNGLTVYRVTKQGSSVTILENQSGNTWEHIVLPTIEQFVNSIKEIILDEENRSSNQWIRLSKLSQIFHRKHNVSIKQVVSHHLPGKTTKDLLASHHEFAVHQIAEDTETYITLFKMPQPHRN